MTEHIVRLSLHLNTKLIVYHNSILDNKSTIQIVDPFDDEREEDFGYPTLEDLSIIMYRMVGNGVTTKLAEELALRLNLPYEEIESALHAIWRDYDGGAF